MSNSLEIKDEVNIGSILSNKYEIIRLLGEGGMGVVWLAKNLQTQSIVTLKVIKEKFRTTQLKSLLFFKKEADILQGLEHSQISRLIEFDFSGPHFYIVMDYQEGRTLQDYLDKEKQFDLSTFLEIALQLCEIFHYIHGQNILHCDIKPNNILIHRENEELTVKILDFGISLLLPVEINAFQRSAGTSAYMSPEQAGFLRRKVDHRSDLYSLGIIFYHMLAGNLPYREDNVFKLIHRHIASSPFPIRSFNPGVPALLEDVVFKLLAKEAEDRYPDAWSLGQDIKAIKESLAKDETPDFPLAMSFNRNSKTIPIPFVGREEELKILRNAYDQAVKNHGTAILISGASGVGKTHMVEYFQEYTLKEEGIFLSVNNSELQEKEPLRSIESCLKQFLEIITLFEDDKKNAIIDNLNRRLGQGRKLVIESIPSMAKYLQYSQQLENLSDNAERQRFDKVLQQTLISLAEGVKSTVLFIDNIQWADLGTLSFLNSLIPELAKHNILLIMNLRTPINEESEEYPFVKQIQQSSHIKRVFLASHHLEDIREILTPLIRDNPSKLETMSMALCKKTGGNIKFAKDLLYVMNQKGMLESQWDFQEEEFSQITASTTSLELIKENMDSFDSEIRRCFSLMSIMGKEVYLFDLFQCFSDVNKEYFSQVISQGSEAGVVYIKENYVSFSHGSFQNIFYQEITAEERNSLHQKAAEYYEQMENSDDHIFTLAHHYSRTDIYDKAFQYLYIAGNKAVKERSYTDALSWFLKAQAMKDRIELTEDQNLQILQGLGYTYSYLGQNEKARLCFLELESLVDNPLKKSDLLEKVGEGWIEEGNFPAATQSLEKAYALLGENVDGNLAGKILKELLSHSFSINKKGIYIEAHGPKADLTTRKKLRILERLDFINFWTGNSTSLLHNHFKSLNICKSLGASSETLRLLCVHMAIMISIPTPSFAFPSIKKRVLFNLEKANEVYLNIKGSPPSKLLFKAVEAMILFTFEGDINNSLKSIRKVMETFWLERSTVFIQELTSIYSQILEGANAFEELLLLGDRIEGLAQIFETPILYSYAKTYRGMGMLFTGQVDRAIQLLEEACEDLIEKNDKVFYVIAGKYLMKALFQGGEHNQARKLYQRLTHFMDENKLYHPAFCGLHGFFVQSEAQFNLEKGFYVKGSKKPIKRALRELEDARKRFPNLKSMDYTARLVYLISRKKHKEAHSLFKEGEDYFHLRKEPYYKGLFNRFYSYICKEDIQEKYLKKAYLLLDHCNAHGEAKKIENYLESADPSMISQQGSDIPMELKAPHIRSNRELDLIIDMGKKIGTIHELDKLLPGILEQALLLIGAEQGEIFLQKDDGLQPVTSPESNEVDQIPCCSSLVKKVAQERIPILIPNAMEDPVFMHDSQVKAHHLKSILCAPLICKEKFLGVIYLSNHRVGNLFSDHEMELINALSAEAAIAIDNALLLKQTTALQVRLSNIINSIPSGIIAVDKKGQVLQYNKPLISMLNGQKNQDDDDPSKSGRPFWEEFPDLEPCKPLFEKVLKEDQGYEEIEQKIDSKTFSIGISALIGSEKTYGAVIKLNDITEARKNQEHMVQLQKMETVSTMVGGLAHDFNNTLTGISATANYLSSYVLDNTEPDMQEISQSMETIGTAIGRASGLVNQLLTFSMKKESQVIAIDMKEILRHCSDVSRRSFDRRIDMIQDLPEQKAVVMADPAQLEQVILNILINGSHAMTIMRSHPEDWGGCLTVKLEKKQIREDKKLKILHLENGDYWCLKIGDNGVGMDKETRSKIFEPFFTTKKSGQGTGLGLAMAYSIIRRLNGYLEVYTEPGQGSTFSIYLPAQEQEPTPLVKEEEPVFYLKGEGTILIAEDENILRTAISKSLEARGYQVIQAENGLEALEYFRNNYRSIDLVILDMVMPEMTGHETYYAMKEIHPGVEVILTSGFEQDDRVQDLLRNGVKYFLQKPYGKNDLFQFMEQMDETEYSRRS